MGHPPQTLKNCRTGVQTDSARPRGTQATGGSATRGSESPTGSGHGSMGGPTLRSNASPFRRRGRKTNSSQSSCLGTLCKGANPEEIWVRQFISPLVEFPGHVVGGQRAEMGVEKEDQLHQDRSGAGLLGSKVEHRHDVALIVTTHRESDPGGQRALVREDHVTEEEGAP